jgi:endonuclease YncB( thermonuclease family)
VRRRLVKAALVTSVVVFGAVATGCDAEPTVESPEEADAAAEPGASVEVEPEAGRGKPPRRRLPVVARVLDGDTLALRNGTRVRLVQIDAPEAGGECYAGKSAAQLRRLVPAGARVRLERDPRLDNRDRYGRLLRYVFRGRENVNLALVRRGAASVWFYEDDRGRYAARLVRAADAARARGRGAWGACEASTDYTSAWTTRPKARPLSAGAGAGGGGGGDCHPSYAGACLDPNASDYDCAGGEGDGPEYTGFVRVVGPDEYELDRDGDGLACEAT